MEIMFCGEVIEALKTVGQFLDGELDSRIKFGDSRPA